MADTQPLAPTDADIDALDDLYQWTTTKGRRSFARAVLAKWGQLAGEHTNAELRQMLDESFEEKKKCYFALSQHQQAIANLIAERDALKAVHSEKPVAWLDPWSGTNVTTDPDAYGKHGIPLVRQHPVAHREPEPTFDDLRVQAVYEILCDDTDWPPKNEPQQHWEGWIARRIVERLLQESVVREPLTDEQIDDMHL